MKILIIVGIYLLIGLVSLAFLELKDKRISRKIKNASREAQVGLINSGIYAGGKMSLIILLGSLWLLYPVALYGAIESWIDDRGQNAKKQ